MMILSLSLFSVLLLVRGVLSENLLFAIVGGSSCAELLKYGPQPITLDGSADGYPYYFATNTTAKDIAHTEWTQVVTSDGISEIFRIYWSFATAKTIAARFISATSAGEAVSWRVVTADPVQEYTYSGTWWFSSGAAIGSGKFSVGSTQSGFSSDDGAWGAGSGIINANGNPTGYSTKAFWGMGNWDADDAGCSKIYKAGTVYTSFGTDTKSFMYYSSTPVPSAAPTEPVPTNDPSFAPTRAPTIAASKTPTRAPTIAPTKAPTISPSAAATITGEEQLFAVVGGGSCAEALFYGPESLTTAGSTVSGNAYYLSTSTVSRNVAHTNWLQIVTSDGETELFRIYWVFHTQKTLAQRFASAVSFGEAVSYRVVDADTGLEYTYTGVWRFSNSAAITTSKFNVATTTGVFSADDGAWGGGTGTIDANGSGYTASAFWGIGNWNGADASECSHIYKAGVSYSSYGTNTRTFMYYFAPVPPSAEPTTAPTLAPTRTPTAKPTSAAPTMSNPPTLVPTRVPSFAATKAPTLEPTVSATVMGDQMLFAVIGGTSCTENLYYGPQAITTAGSADGQRPYFFSTGTAARIVAHTNWLQIVTSDGVTELFRIYWVFNTPKTLANRFVFAPVYGEDVSYRVVDAADGQEYLYTGQWRFSNTASMTSAMFDVTTTTYGFSADDGAWGAGSGSINGNGNAYLAASFWGMGNWNSADSSECYKIYRAGVASFVYGTNTKSFMYYFAPTPPTAAPTTGPTAPTQNPTAAPSTIAPTLTPTREPTMGPTAPTRTPTEKPSTATPSLTPTRNPTAAPTLVPTRDPTLSPTRNPTAEPTTVPTRGPSAAPSMLPTAAPTVSASVGGDPLLFAVVGGSSCAEALYYGPQAITGAGSADGLRPYFLSTSTFAKDVAHTNWLQVVTTDGVTESFRIYWVFTAPKTLAQRFAGAVSFGEAVSYRVVDAESGQEYSYSGTWRFSNSAAITTSKFDAVSTMPAFSADDGAWGAGSGTVDANGSGFTAASFWGVGNWDSNDGDCAKIYKAGVVMLTSTNSKSYMYYYAPGVPSLSPTAAPTGPTRAPSAVPSTSPTSSSPSRAPSTSPTTAPTRSPTAKPTAAATSLVPTAVPTVSGTVSGDPQLFAVVGGSSCAETLYYGPQAITKAGSADGLYPYFLSTSTAARDVAHTNWLQNVTKSDGTELFRIYWTFTFAKTLAQRFAGAVSSGEAVSYRVVDAATKQEYFYSGTWRFSNGALITTSKFDVAITTYGFSSDDGAWGAGNGFVDANGNGYSAANFWGIGNWDSADGSECYKVYRQGVASTAYGTGVKAFIYYNANAQPSAAPTRVPTTPTRVPTQAPTVTLTGAPSMGFNVPPSVELFAVVGGNSCSEGLYYGPQAISVRGSADGLRPYFLSTSTASKAVAHKYWLQVVTSDGNTELFRVYWTFATARTLSQHFAVAVITGETVSYRVVVASSGQESTYSGTWRFSNGAGDMAVKFETATTQLGFSADDGAWGAGSGNLDANGGNPLLASFWGVGNWDSGDTECSKVYTAGSASNVYGTGVKVYMYYTDTVAPTATPTTAPSNPTYAPVATVAPTRVPTKMPTVGLTRSPTKTPTKIPTRVPSRQPTRSPTATAPPAPNGALLFAVVGGTSCAESLYYGPQAITTAGSADGLRPYFLSTSTAAWDVPHDRWLQIVTSNGATELFRIYWTFNSSKILQQRFVDATTIGESVSYRVEEIASELQVYTYNGIWRFSNGALISASKFLTSYTQSGFSADDGAWGGGSGTIDGNSNGYSASNFWGIGNWDAADSSECYKVYRQGVYSTAYGTGVKSYMYYYATPVPRVSPTRAPTTAPSAPAPISSSYELFAVLGGQQCSENLPYGPDKITVAGASSTYSPYYLSTGTSGKDSAHTEWIQVVTSDGVTEIMRIYWTFSTPKTLAQHFADAVQFGESVSYRVEYTYQGFTNWLTNWYDSTWRFSSASQVSIGTFDGRSGFLGGRYGAWGTASTWIDGNGAAPSTFFGVGNFNGLDSGECHKVYRSGTSSVEYGTALKTFMYYRTDESLVPTAMPSAPPQVVFNVQQVM